MVLCWNIIYSFQVVKAIKGNDSKNAESTLLEWCQYRLKRFAGIKINNFQSNKWKDGYALNGIIHSFQPNLFNMDDLSKLGDAACLENAIYHAKQTFGVEPIFLPTDMINDFVDSKSLVIYISQLYMALTSLDSLSPFSCPNSLSPAPKDETLSKVEKAIFDELQFLSSKRDSTLLPGLQNPTLKDLKKQYINYNVLFKELKAAIERIGSVKMDYDNVMKSNVACLDKENVTLSFEKFMNTYKTLQSSALVAHNAVQSKLISHLMEQFDQVFEVIKQVKHDHDTISKTLNDEESLLSETQEKNLLCEKTVAVFPEMNPFVKSLNDLSEHPSCDQSINELNKKKLHSTGNKVLITSLQKLLEKSQKVLEEKKYKDKMKNWLSGIQICLHLFLQLKIDFSEKQIDSELNEIKACLSDVDLKWKEFLKLTTEWNKTLCDIVKNNDYAVMQEDVQKDFTDLQKMLVNSNNQVEQANIVKEKLKGFAKEEKMQILSDAREAADVQKELVDQLSKLEKKVLELFEHNVSLNEVTMVIDNDKLVLLQSCDHLLKEYKDRVHLFNKAKINQQNATLQFITKEAESLITRLKEINQMKDVFNEDFQTDKNLRQYYSTCQNWLSKIEKQKEYLEELNGFVNEICGFLPNEAKQIVDNAFENLNHFKTIHENEFKRFNVLMLQLLNQRLQLSSIEIQEITEEVSNLENKKFSSLEDAASLLINLKYFVCKCDQIELELKMIADLLTEPTESGTFDVLVDQRLTQQKNVLLNVMQLLLFTFFTQKKKYLSFLNNFVFSAWLPNIKKESYKNIKINASDITFLQSQLNNIKESEKQIRKNSFSSFLTNKYVSINDVLKESLINEVNFAVEEWNYVHQWANKRKELLLYGLQKLEDLMQCKKDLLDYLQENEEDLLLWNQLDLYDKSNIESKLNLLENITDAMQQRQKHVIHFDNVADDLLAIAGGNRNAVNNIIFHVAEVHNIWNRTVKNSICYSKKLQKSHQMVIELEEGNNVVNTWLTLTSSLLEIVTENLDSAKLKAIEAILIQIKEKDSDRNKIKKCLESVRDWYAQLDGNDDTRSPFSVRKKVQELNEQFTDVIEKIDNLNNIKRKGLLCACFRFNN